MSGKSLDDLRDLAIDCVDRDLRLELQGRPKYLAALAARALRLARDLAAAEEELAAIERDMLVRLYGEDAGKKGSLADWRRRLAADCRAGRFRSGSREAVILRDGLLEVTARRLRILNLHYLSGRKRGAESAI